jgi:hypothetical protein
MKLRIQGDSLRLRLTQSEVASLHSGGRVDCAIRFPAGRSLGYSVVSSPEATAVCVSYAGDSICVVLPHAVVAAWAESNEVTIQGTDSGLRILVEKDFQCLHQPADATPGAFPNPLA